MMRLIDADALYKSFGATGNCNNCPLDAYKCQYYNEHTLMEFCERIEDAPTVDAESLITQHEDIGYERGYRDGYAEAMEATDNAEPVKHGHWVGIDDRVWGCDNCGWIYEDDEPYYNFCPHCGSKMDVSDTDVGKTDETCN